MHVHVCMSAYSVFKRLPTLVTKIGSTFSFLTINCLNEKFGGMRMSANTETYLKEIQSVATKSLIENREISSLMQEQNDLIKANNYLLEDLLSEIKNLAEEIKNR